MANKEATRVSAHVDRVLEASTSFSGAGALGSGVFLAGAGAGVAAAGLGVAVGAEVGQVTAEASLKAPELPHVYVVVAGVPPTVAALVQVKIIVDPAASVAPAAAGAVPVASPPVLAAVV
jgi:hypothetical protein